MAKPGEITINVNLEGLTLYVIQILNTQRDMKIGRVFLDRQAAEIECQTLEGQHPTWQVWYVIRKVIP